MDSVLQNLQKAGLTGNEAKVYWTLLTHEGLSGGETARKAAIDRSLTYTLLNNLKDKGFVTFAVRNKKKIFSAADPANLLTPVLESENFLRNLIPSLQKIRPKREEEQAFKIYEGTQGIKSYVRLFTQQRNIGSFGGTGKLYDFIERHVPHLLRKEFHENIQLRVIGTTSLQTHPMNDTLGAKVRVLPAVSPATTTVTDDFVTIHLITEHPFAIVIENKEIVESYWNYFEFLWEQAAHTNG